MQPQLETGDLDKTLIKTVGFEERKYYGQGLSLLRSDSPEALKKACCLYIVKFYLFYDLTVMRCWWSKLFIHFSKSAVLK